MDFLLKEDEHEAHDVLWAIFSPHYNCPVCIGCMVEIIENTQLIPLQKKPALTEMLRLLKHQSAEIMEVFMAEEMVVWHLLTVLLDNMQIEEDSVQALCTEGILRLASLVGSEDLVTSVIDTIGKKMESTRDHNRLVGYYMLVGKLLYQLPGLANKMVLDYGYILDQYGEDMCVCVEKVQSELAYIFILIIPVHNVMSPRLIHNIHTGTLGLLVTAQNEQAQINGLDLQFFTIRYLIVALGCPETALVFSSYHMYLQDLLKKLLEDDGRCHSLLNIKKDDHTILTVLKKLLLSKKHVLQINVAQVLLQILTKSDRGQYGKDVLDSDIAEFLFEGLHTSNIEQIQCMMKVLKQLATLDYFYKRYHAVYGIESVIRCLTTADELKNPALQQDGFELMTEILRRQPSDIPLFVSQNVVKNCLRIIHAGIQQKKLSVSLSAQRSLAAVLRKDYLLSPAPFLEITQCIVSAGEMLQETVNMNRHTSNNKHSKKMMKGQSADIDDVLNNFCDVMTKAANFAIECSTDPTSCESNYLPPGAGDVIKSKLSIFIEDLLLLLDETFIPVIVVCWIDVKTPDIYWKFIQLFSLLHQLAAEKSCDLVNKLVEVGFLGNVVDVTALHRGSVPLEFASGVTKFLQLVVQCYINTDQMGCSNLDQQLISHTHLKWSLNDLSKGFVHQDVQNEEVSTYLTVLYILYKCGNRLLNNEDLASVLCSILEIHTSLEQLSPISRRQYLFLLAWLSTNSDFDMWRAMPAGVKSLPSILNEDIDDDVMMLLWCYSDQILAPVCGHKMLSVYLKFVTIETFHDTVNDLVESHSISHLFDNKHFTENIVIFLSNSSEDIVRKLSVFHDHMIDHFLALDSNPDPDIAEEMYEEGHNSRLGRLGQISGLTEQTLQDVFLNKYTDTKCHNVQALLELYLKVYRYSCTGKTFNKKILVHVLNQIKAGDTTITQDVDHVMLVAVLASLSNKSDNQAVSMIVKHDNFLAYIEGCISDPYYTSYAIGCDILTELIKQAGNIQVHTPITINLSKLSASLRDQTSHSTGLSLLTAIFDTKLTSNIIKLETKLDSVFFKSLLLTLQQLIMKEHEVTSQQSVQCLISMMSYVSTFNQNLYEALLYQPWTRVVLDVLINIAEGTVLQQHMVDLLSLYIKDKHTVEVIKFVPDFIHRLVPLVTKETTHDVPNGCAATKILISQILSSCEDCLLASETKRLTDFLS